MFFSSKCSLFHNSNVFCSCIIHILYTGCAKIKRKNNSGAKRLMKLAHLVKASRQNQNGRTEICRSATESINRTWTTLGLRNRASGVRNCRLSYMGRTPGKVNTSTYLLINLSSSLCTEVGNGVMDRVKYKTAVSHVA